MTVAQPAGSRRERAPGRGDRRVGPEPVSIGAAALPGAWTLPAEACGVVVFVHGSGSSRLSPRNQQVADVLHDYGLGTLLFDLLTHAEAEDRANVFDIDLLSRRVVEALQWLQHRGQLPAQGAGLFGSSTGAAAALRAAALHPALVAAVVARGGRPDLAGEVLPQVQAPTLLVVGGLDTAVLELNRDAARRLGGPHRLEIVPAAGHLFEEAGALLTVAHLAGQWFAHQLDGRRTS